MITPKKEVYYRHVLINSNGGTNETYLSEDVLKNTKVAQTITLLDNSLYTQVVSGKGIAYVEVKQEVANESKRSSK